MKCGLILVPAAIAHPQNPAISDFQNFFLTAGANQHYSDLVPSLRGALANVINAGRDAVDAGGAKDEGAVRVRRSRVVLTP